MSDFNQQIIDEFRANEGRVGGPFEGAPMILIHDIGARSGTERVRPLVHFAEDELRTVIVASKGGAPTNPDWYHNLKANPKIDVEVGTERYAVIADEITGPERDEVWQRIIAKADGFREYQEKTDRLIPLFRLTRVS